MIPVEHTLLPVEPLERWGFGLAFKARCACRLWESTIEDNRPAVIRQHTIHAMNAAVIYA